MGWYYFSTLMAWNKDAIKGAQPTGWKDFWDTKNFPGPRSLYNDVFGTLEFALMADGVPPDKLYPLDLDRAFRKLEEIRPAVKVWWKSGAQSVQLVTSGEVNFIPMWNARAMVAANTGNVGYTYNQGILDFENLVIPKGAPSRGPCAHINTIHARQTSFCGVLRPATQPSSRARSSGDNQMHYSSCIPLNSHNRELAGNPSVSYGTLERLPRARLRGRVANARKAGGGAHDVMLANPALTPPPTAGIDINRGALETPSFLCRRASLVLKWPTNQSATVAERGR